MPEKYESLLASDVNRDELFLELYVHDEQFGELSIQNGKAILKIFKPLTANDWVLDFAGMEKLMSDMQDFLATTPEK